MTNWKGKMYSWSGRMNIKRVLDTPRRLCGMFNPLLWLILLRLLFLVSCFTNCKCMLGIRSALLATEPSSVSTAVLAVSAAMCTRGEIIATPKVRRNIPQLCGRPCRNHRQPSGNEFCLQSCRGWQRPSEWLCEDSLGRTWSRFRWWGRGQQQQRGASVLSRGRGGGREGGGRDADAKRKENVCGGKWNELLFIFSRHVFSLL